MTDTNTQMINIEDINVGTNVLENHTEEEIQIMKDSISTNGLINPISIDINNNLICGNVRLEAHRRLSYIQIECKVFEGTEEELRLLQLDENLVRKTLSEFEKEDLLEERTNIMKSMKIKGSTQIIADENDISLRLLQMNNKNMKEIKSEPVLFKNMKSMNKKDNFTRDEIEKVSQSKNVQSKIVNGKITSTSEVREELVKEKEFNHEPYDLNEVLDFFKTTVQEMNEVVERSDDERMKELLSRIEKYTSKKVKSEKTK